VTLPELERPGRRGCCHPRPPQSRTCRFPASGSSRESFAVASMILDSPSYRSSLHRACEHSLVEEHPASSAIHCRFVDRFDGFIVPSPVSRQWLSPRDASLPSFGSRRARFPALTGTMKALRLPIRAAAVTYVFAPAVHGFLLLCVRRSAPERPEVPSGPGPCCAGCPASRLSSVDANGISQVFRRSIPCLCSVPRPRSNRRALAIAVTSMLPPLCAQRRLRAMADFGADWRSFGTCCPTLRVSHCCSHARLASGWPARPLPGGSRTHWIATRGFSSC
jgi:hypothetical protein